MSIEEKIHHSCLQHETSPEDSVNTNNAESSSEKSLQAMLQCLSKEKILSYAKKLLHEPDIAVVAAQIDQVKIAFYKKHKAEIDYKRNKYLDEGGVPEDFKLPTDLSEAEFKVVFKKLQQIRAKYNAQQEEIKQRNLEQKHAIIEKIKVLITKQESLNKTFEEFKELQRQWNAIGPVPPSAASDVFKSYNYAIEQFYDYIEINKALRDLDYKKNIEAKTALCEKAEALCESNDIVMAGRILQDLHEQWKSIGPVPKEMREPMWQRFSKASSILNKKQQEFFIKLKAEQKQNLARKIVLAEQLEAICSATMLNAKDWQQATSKVIELQNQWKNTGYADRPDDSKVSRRFKKASDLFFRKRRVFFQQNKAMLEQNCLALQQLCEQAEKLVNTDDWNKATDEMKKLQRKWKNVGPVSKKDVTTLWQRFKAAGDNFFAKKSEYHAFLITSLDDNFKKKEALIAEMENFAFTGNAHDDLHAIKNFQRRWAEIGKVPENKKVEIQKKYNLVINQLFDKVNINQAEKKMLLFKDKINNLQALPEGKKLLLVEREKTVKRYRQLENETILLENNKGLFRKSKNADAIIREIDNKIKIAENEMKILEEQLSLIEKFLRKE